jgi:nicotinamidase-related amidase
MSTFADRPHTALMVIDVQNGVVANSINRDAIVSTIAALVDRAREEDVPVLGAALRRRGADRGE